MNNMEKAMDTIIGRYYKNMTRLLVIVIIVLLVICSVMEIKQQKEAEQRHQDVKTKIEVMNNILKQMKKEK